VGEPVTDIDHDHKTNKVRGLLCHACNLTLGLARDNVEILANLITPNINKNSRPDGRLFAFTIDSWDNVRWPS
jgi:hypothetical protein